MKNNHTHQINFFIYFLNEAIENMPSLTCADNSDGICYDDENKGRCTKRQLITVLLNLRISQQVKCGDECVQVCHKIVDKKNT